MAIKDPTNLILKDYLVTFYNVNVGIKKECFR
jgi:hypothetical protein